LRECRAGGGRFGIILVMVGVILLVMGVMRVQLMLILEVILVKIMISSLSWAAEGSSFQDEWI